MKYTRMILSYFICIFYYANYKFEKHDILEIIAILCLHNTL